eukprot:gnl/Spiro4/12204_TR6443_c0_g1_i2.p1 gnl/Spiro4/12204_TR6443_c0_g1~~gnl/Spiro4/12204_TR6443_c0_g1_i2.p1  ORF type:complete len:875 (+),score=331.11 gnl/Spiro4/12204_TR6443_c0_g1_i2:30-2627(+)
MTQRLQDLIRSIRACKTAADERSTIAKECALIRTAFKQGEDQRRHQNVAKLLFIQMLGYPTHFGQMECLKLIVLDKFRDKRIGYLGLMLLLDERQEVLMLVTNSLKLDMGSGSQFVVGMALAALGNISSTDIARDLSPEVERLLSKSSNPYIRKKAALCAIRVITKVPELIEDYIDHVTALLNDKNHAVLLTTMSLAVVMAETKNPAVLVQFRKYVPKLVSMLKSLMLAGYTPEHDFGGITDPFLQVKILRLLRILGTGDNEASDAMNDILAQVATNTESTKNAGHAILYECVQTIMSIESEPGLRVLAINILGRFLSNRDNNIRYVALHTLAKVVSADLQAVQRHRNTIVDCLKESDMSIRKRALDLIYLLVNESNIRVLVRELLNYLMIADPEFKGDLTNKICMVVEKHSPNKKWQIDTIITVLTLAGNYVRDDICSNLIRTVTQNEELHAYTARKVYFALKNAENFQQSLVQVAVWCVGEYGDLLVGGQGIEDGDEPVVVTEMEVINLLDSLLANPTTSVTTKEYILTTLAKLSSRFHPSSLQSLKDLLSRYHRSMSLELQQRSCEYMRLFDWPDAVRYSIVERMPLPEAVEANALQDQDDDMHDHPQPPPQQHHLQPQQQAQQQTSLPSHSDNPLAALAGMGAPTVAAPAATASTDIFALLGGTPTMDTTHTTNTNPLGDIFGMVAATPTPAPTPAPATLGAMPSVPFVPSSVPTVPASVPVASPFAFPSAAAPALAPVVVFNENGLSVELRFEKTDPQNPGNTKITAYFTNVGAGPLQDFVFRASVPKYMKLRLETASSSVIPVHATPQVNQLMYIENPTDTLAAPGQKRPVQMRAQISYKSGGTPTLKEITITNLPPGL